MTIITGKDIVWIDGQMHWAKNGKPITEQVIIVSKTVHDKLIKCLEEE